VLRKAAAYAAWRGPLDVWGDGDVAMAAYGATAGPDVRDEPVPHAYAAARWQAGRLTLERDELGQRPLFYARRGTLVAFASDVEVLVALGAATGELDRETVTAVLAGRPQVPERTGFAGVRRVVGGRRVTLTRHGEEHGRWWFPEYVAEEAWDVDTASTEVARRLTEAVVEEAGGRRTALLLSGGRDSGAVAVALARAGIVADCLTHVTSVPGAASEAAPARDLAERLGHRWHAVPVPTEISGDDLRGLVRLAGTPFGPAGAQYVLATRDTLRELGTEVLLDGDGGDLLFSTSPLVAFDLLRRGRVAEAVATARYLHGEWVHPYAVQARATVRAVAPTRLVEWRESRRPVPPWVLGADRRAVTRRAPYLHRRWLVAPRTERADLVEGLLTWGASAKGEITDRVYGPLGVVAASPIAHPSLVRLALELPVGLRSPCPEPKRVLTRALLADVPAVPRVKAGHRRSWDAWIAAQAAALPDLLTPRSRLAGHGYAEPGELVTASQVRWLNDLRFLADVEAWLCDVRTDDA
jgi:asparagine synthetase B (glutamine-hydrolysing)